MSSHPGIPTTAAPPVQGEETDASFLARIGVLAGVAGVRLHWSAGGDGARPKLLSVDWTPSMRALIGAEGPLARDLLRRLATPDRRAFLGAIRPSESHYGRPGHVFRIGEPRGRGVWVKVSYRDEPCAHGGTDVIVAVRDVTEQQQREEQLHRELRRQDQMADIAGIGTWTLDLATNELKWSARVFEIHDMEPGPTPTVAEAVAFYEPEAISVVEDGLEQLIAGRARYDFVLPMRTARGRRIWVHAMGDLETNPEGKPLRLIGTFRDVTDQYSAEERLRLSEERYMFALEGAKDGLWDWDLESNRVHFSPRWKELIGYSDDEIESEFDEWASRVPDDDRERAMEALTDCFEGRAPQYRAEFRMRHKDGSWRWILARAKVVARGEGGQPLRMVGTHTDITSEVQMREELEQARAAAEQAASAKADFLAMMSHEIRTPLNGIMGLCQLLMEDRVTERQADSLAVINESAGALLDIINDVLDLSKSEAGKLELEDAPFDPAHCIEGTAALLRHRADLREGLEFSVRIDPAVPTLIMGDMGRMRQVLLNLVGNALKFTEQGSVVVTARIEDGPEGAARLRVQVEDTGIGIEPGAEEHLFQPFTQADSTTTRRFGGTGLGLSISRRMVELMGGTIGCAQRDGGGAVFWFEVPVRLPGAEALEEARVRAGATTAAKEAALAGARVLVVEDNAVNRLVARRILESLGCVTVTVEGGQEALDILRDADFDVVLMDFQMPGMDGLEATRRLRSREADQGLARVPVVALTAGTMEGDAEACLDAGMDDYLSKPIVIDALRAVLVRHVARA